MLEEESVKKNSVIESYCKASIYKPLIDYLKQNLDKLSDFIISESEILSHISEFSFNSFSEDFKNTREFRNLVFCKNPHDPKIFHIITKNTEIPKDYTIDVIRTVAENGYNTQDIIKIIEYWKNIEKNATESFKNHSKTQTRYNTYSLNKLNQTENYSNLNMNIQTLDGTYGSHIYKDRDSGRFYSVPSYDNYNDESNS